MKQFFEYGGRGDREISDDSLFQLDSDAGGVFLITQKVGKVDTLRAARDFHAPVHEVKGIAELLV